MQSQILEVETDEGNNRPHRPPPPSTNTSSKSSRPTPSAKAHSPANASSRCSTKAPRWVYQEPGWFGEFDNCLWDILGKTAGRPVYDLIGRVRDRLPVYLTAGDMDLQGYLDHIDGGRTFGVNAYKLHTYKGGKADIPLLTDVRKAVGDDYDLLNDPVCSYNLREAIEVGTSHGRARLHLARRAHARTENEPVPGAL